MEDYEKTREETGTYKSRREALEETSPASTLILGAEPGPESVPASVVVAHGISCPAACGIFPDQGSNLIGRWIFIH